MLRQPISLIEEQQKVKKPGSTTMGGFPNDLAAREGGTGVPCKDFLETLPAREAAKPASG